MERSRSRTLSQAERQEVWRRFRAGESLRQIARGLSRNASSVTDLVKARGGVAPMASRRSARTLTLHDREHISRGLVAGDSFRQIACELGRPTSTISREVGRHGGRQGYRAVLADERAWQRARRPKVCRLARSHRLRHQVASKLRQDWSPNQIAQWLKLEHPHEPEQRVSHETIYRSLFIQARGALKKELMTHLRSQRQLRRSRNAERVPQGRGQIPDAVSISERPAQIEDRAVPGHWEGDLICGANNSYVGTLVERHSRFVMLVKLAGKDTQTVVRALARRMKRLPATLRGSLTWDRGAEMTAHARFTLATDMAVYFCDPRSPWQRGSNENTNGLLRQYLPRKADLSLFTQTQLDAISRRLNQRPRETLAFRTPAFKLAQALQ
ncbi:IS30 family transposase [Tahibacter soli]|uniref:IS30 family transposase n=1 Tax=Tahibacter soli TaxID=2983605 RepID=A0A9X3YNQ1_9GAMM|nr:IS30 family transposase [Tahibacter soli]MDC8014669.1 IS30 family transposase [Tahibacter soli]MDC8014820.1 IS30 family transposase [Tahibacter soli]MDC8014852.1 IS30 family transposase [Tahibacter soli]MDC8015124.1 IS30 family transposase [Tahibacter soli]MDC8015750.1 IS30 family transposase [Tahibacter soli]